MKKIFVAMTVFLLLSVSGFAKKVTYQKIMTSGIVSKVDINRANKKEMMEVGVSKGYADKIIKLRNVKGNIEDIKELERINGIGKKTREKLEKFFIIENVPAPKDLYINQASDELLGYYGFNKKEIKIIRKTIKENGRINGSIMLRKILSKEKYNKYKDVIKFDIY